MLSAAILMSGLAASNFATSSAGVFCGLSKWYHQRTVVCAASAGRASAPLRAVAPVSFRKVLRSMFLPPSWLVLFEIGLQECACCCETAPRRRQAGGVAQESVNDSRHGLDLV